MAMHTKAFMFALAVAVTSAPATAQVFELSITGTATGSKNTLMCNSGSPPDCLATYAGGWLQEDYQSNFYVALYSAYLPLGDSTFEWGNPHGSGYWTGIINNSDGYLTGRDLFFTYEDAALRFGQVGSGYILASAPTFDVGGGVPEPGTWAMMLLGFGVVGASLRRSRNRRGLAIKLPAQL